MHCASGAFFWYMIENVKPNWHSNGLEELKETCTTLFVWHVFAWIYFRFLHIKNCTRVDIDFVFDSQMLIQVTCVSAFSLAKYLAMVANTTIWFLTELRPDSRTLLPGCHAAIVWLHILTEDQKLKGNVHIFALFLSFVFVLFVRIKFKHYYVTSIFLNLCID